MENVEANAGANVKRSRFRWLKSKLIASKLKLGEKRVRHENKSNYVGCLWCNSRKCWAFTTCVERELRFNWAIGNHEISHYTSNRTMDYFSWLCVATRQRFGWKCGWFSDNIECAAKEKRIRTHKTEGKKSMRRNTHAAKEDKHCARWMEIIIEHISKTFQINKSRTFITINLWIFLDPWT